MGLQGLHQGPGSMPISVMLLLLLLLSFVSGWTEVNLPPLVRVDVTLTNLECSQHAVVVVATNQSNSSSDGINMVNLSPLFTCETAMSEISRLKDASSTGALVFSWGRWDQTSSTAAECNVVGGASDGSSTQRSHMYLRTDTRYAVCGVSFYNDHFGSSGLVSFTERSSARSVLSFVSTTNGSSTAASRPVSQCAISTGGGQACSFHIGEIAFEAANCSTTQYDVAPGLSFCASLNRSECSLVPHTCGPCLECHVSSSADASAEQGSGGDADEQGSGASAANAASTPTWSAFGNSPCALAQAQPLPAPTLLTEGDKNAIGPAGAAPTSLRLQWLKPDCAAVQRFAIRLKEGSGSWVSVYEGHPGGGFSQTDQLRLIATPGPATPSPPPPVGATAGSPFATPIGAVMLEAQSMTQNTADRCINGNVYDRCEHKYSYTDPWFSLRVDASSAIHEVVVYNRRQSWAWSRLNPYHVYVGNSYGEEERCAPAGRGGPANPLFTVSSPYSSPRVCSPPPPPSNKRPTSALLQVTRPVVAGVSLPRPLTTVTAPSPSTAAGG